MKRFEFGVLEDGARVEAVELSNASGVGVRILTLGAAIQSLSVPDRKGERVDVVLGYASAAEYLAKPQYFGATVGRYANRIAAGRFLLDGERYTLERNDGPNHLHGGVRGLDKVLWRIESVEVTDASRVSLSYVSPDGEGGYPGTLSITALYTLNDRNELIIDYRATTDRPTIVNISGHSYFNLAGEASGTDILEHCLTLAADYFTPVDATLIPTGECRNVAGTPFDFRRSERIGRRIRFGRDKQICHGRGYDHNLVINGTPGILRPFARVEDPRSGRVLELLGTAPAVQFYSGNFLDGTSVGKSGCVYRQGDGFCLEPQTFPDAPNRPEFPSARLDPGQVYRNTMVYRFSSL